MSRNSTVGMLLFVVVGLVFAGFGGYMWTEQTERIDSYEKVDATVVSSEVEVVRNNDPDGGTDRTYRPAITYEYTVDGETYRSSNVLPGPGSTSKGKDWAQGIVEDHPEGETVTAYYDPEYPSNAFLVKNREWMFLGVGAFGGLFALIGFWQLGKRFTAAGT